MCPHENLYTNVSNSVICNIHSLRVKYNGSIIQPQKVLTHASTWMDLENMMPRKRSQSQDYILYGSSYMKCRAGKYADRDEINGSMVA